MVRRLFAGGRWIRTIGPAYRILRYLSKEDEAPKVQPEAVAAGFEDKRNPRDIAACAGGLSVQPTCRARPFQ